MSGWKNTYEAYKQGVYDATHIFLAERRLWRMEARRWKRAGDRRCQAYALAMARHGD